MASSCSEVITITRGARMTSPRSWMQCKTYREVWQDIHKIKYFPPWMCYHKKFKLYNQKKHVFKLLKHLFSCLMNKCFLPKKVNMCNSLLIWKAQIQLVLYVGVPTCVNTFKLWQQHPILRFLLIWCKMSSQD